MRTLIIIIVIIALGYLGWQAIQTKPDASTPQATVSDTTSPATASVDDGNYAGKSVDNANVKVSFKGFGPGKEHTGAFSDVKSNLVLNTGGALSGNVTVGMNSLATENDKVTAHLKTADFFDTAKYPTSTFTIKTVLGATAVGTFTIHGVTKDVTFPIVKGATGYTADFTLNLKEFGIDQTFANETVQLIVSVPVK